MENKIFAFYMPKYTLNFAVLNERIIVWLITYPSGNICNRHCLNVLIMFVTTNLIWTMTLTYASKEF